jgi:hypothetical protein
MEKHANWMKTTMETVYMAVLWDSVTCNGTVLLSSKMSILWLQSMEILKKDLESNLHEFPKMAKKASQAWFLSKLATISLKITSYT